MSQGNLKQPFGAPELRILAARNQEVGLNPQQPEGESLSGAMRIGEWWVDPALDEIGRGEETIKIEPRMMRLLCRLAESRGQVVSSQQLLDSVWSGVVVGPASVYQAISALRKILGDTGDTPTYIATVARKGYRLVAPIELRPPEHRDRLEALSPPSPSSSRKTMRTPWVLTIVAVAVFAVAVTAWMIMSAVRERTIVAHPTESIAWPSADLPSIVVLPFRSGSRDEGGQIFAATMTDLVHNRLASQRGLVAVSWHSAGRLGEVGVDLRTIHKRLKADYVLRGSADHVAGKLHVQTSLLNTVTGTELWAQNFSRPVSEIAVLRETIISRIATSLRVTIEPATNAAINLPAYELYMRGLAEYLKLNKEGYITARDIFTRVTALYPEFPRGYFGLSIALEQFVWYPELSSADGAQSIVAQSINALDRAISLDPAFGEAMIERAMRTENPAEAENLIRRGLDLVPSYSVGFWKYALFLFDQGRVGEGLSAIDRGLQVDPLSPLLLNLKSDVLTLYRGDVAGSEAVLRELIENRPDDKFAPQSLAWLRYTQRGETAECIGVLEQFIAHDPTAPGQRYRAAIAYLDVDDPDAAAAVSKEARYVHFEIAQYRRAPHPLHSLHPDDRMAAWQYWSQLTVNPVGEALRDEAVTTGNFAAALAELEKIRTTPGLEAWQTFTTDLSYAHTLVLSGERERGQSVARLVLRKVETEQIGRPESWFARTRAAAFVLLGDDNRALAELAASQKQNDFVRWWYTAELDPLYAHLRHDPKFQALASVAKQHRAQQRQLVDAMRRKGQIPKRR